MCGIAGYFGVEVDQPVIDRLTNSIKHRGPDAQQCYQWNNTGLIHTRLSILELSPLGAQPYQFENLVLAFNGELYNYREVREKLKERGYSFHSNSDTEVLIKAFHCWREESVHQFVGMFAFAVYNSASDELFLFRDRLGVKPLYYAYEQGKLIFASELKSLLILQQDRTVHEGAAFFYFRFGFIPGALSIFKKINKLEAGHFIKLTRSKFSKQTYWKPAFKIEDGKNEQQWLEELEALLISSFKYRMISDVPVGVFLSGGIDSSLLTAILQKHYGGINTFTIGFEETGFDESVYAQQVAQHLQTKHTQKVLRLKEAKDLLFDFYNMYDEPFADTSGIPTACVTQLARSNGMKVVLSADGGDELFGGYSHYQRAGRLYNSLFSVPSGLRRAIARGTDLFFSSSVREKIYSRNLEHKAYAFEEILGTENATHFFEAFLANQSIKETGRLMGNGHGSEYLAAPLQGGDPMQHMMAWDLQHYLCDDLLVKVDRATMHYGMECREPFLDHRLVEFAITMPITLKIREGKGKYMLRKLLKQYLPETFFERKKQGFSIPLFSWFSKDLDEMFVHYFQSEKIREIPFLQRHEVQKELKKYLYYKGRGRQYNIEKMWRILSFMLWWEKYMKV